MAMLTPYPAGLLKTYKRFEFTLPVYNCFKSILPISLMPRKALRPRSIPCAHCNRFFFSVAGRTNHIRTSHRSFANPSPNQTPQPSSDVEDAPMPALTASADSEESNASDSDDEALVAVPTIDLDDLPLSPQASPDPPSPMNQPSEDEYTGACIEFDWYVHSILHFFFISYRGPL